MGQERDAGNGARLAAAETSSTALGRCEGQFRDLRFAKPASNCFFAGKASNSSFHRGVKNAVDLHDIVVKQALRLDHCARWIWRLAPQLRLHLVHHGRETVQVTDVNGEPHTILKAGALRLGNQPDIEESLTDPARGSCTNLLVAGSMPCMPATKIKSPALAPRLQVPSVLIAPAGLSVLTPFGEGACAKLRLDANAIAVTHVRAIRRNI